MPTPCANNWCGNQAIWVSTTMLPWVAFEYGQINWPRSTIFSIVALAEDSEAYQVDILDGSVVKRSLTTATTSALYTAVQQTTDWGAPLGPAQFIAIRIYQLSALIGRGAARTVTLTF